MIKVVPDSNVLISGMFGFKSACRKVLSLAMAREIVLYGSSETFAEFCEKVNLARLKKYWRAQLFTPEKMILEYRSLINIVKPDKELQDLRVVKEDADDDEFFRIALSCNARILVSGDKRVLAVKKYRGIIVVRAADFVESYSRSKKTEKS